MDVDNASFGTLISKIATYVTYIAITSETENFISLFLQKWAKHKPDKPDKFVRHRKKKYISVALPFRHSQFTYFYQRLHG